MFLELSSQEQKDRGIVRDLAKRVDEIASMPIQKEKALMWKKLNKLELMRPMVLIYSIPWDEIEAAEDIVIETTAPFYRYFERQLKQTLYKWEHIPDDTVVSPIIYSTIMGSDTGFGLAPDKSVITNSALGGVNSTKLRHFEPILHDEEDLEKIQTPVITVDEVQTQKTFERISDLFGSILHVQKRGPAGLRFCPVDDIIRWWGISEFMIDMLERPELIHKLMKRFTDASLSRLDQFEKLSVLSPAAADNPIIVGTGGYGFTDELQSTGNQTTACDMWGSTYAQIFSEVSPKMHEEFALRYEKLWLERFALTYYGCCEPLDNKIDMLSQIPNLRKISMSCWIDPQKAAENMKDKYVFSYKPNPALLVGNDWTTENAYNELANVLKFTKENDCRVEIILKTMITIDRDPKRLSRWADMVMEMVKKY